MPRPSQHARGFTLVEVLAALSILAIAALGLVKLMNESAIGYGGVHARALAAIVAENQLIEAVADPAAPVMSEVSGQAEAGGRTWQWTRITSATSNPDLVRIEVRVRAEEDGGELAALSGFRGQH